MIDIFCAILLAAFGVFAGMFLGVGNRAGLIGAIVFGAFFGLILNLPFLPDGDHWFNALLFVSVVAGSITVHFMSANHWIKRRLLEQKGLRFKIFSYYSIGNED